MSEIYIVEPWLPLTSDKKFKTARRFTFTSDSVYAWRASESDASKTWVHVARGVYTSAPPGFTYRVDTSYDANARRALVVEVDMPYERFTEIMNDAATQFSVH